MGDLGFPYISKFDQYVFDELIKREDTKENIDRSKQTPWIRIVSNAIVDLSDILSGYSSETPVSGLVMAGKTIVSTGEKSALTFNDIYGFVGSGGSPVGIIATKGGDSVKADDKDRHRPAPILESLQVEHKNDFGSFRSATITYKVFTVQQFEILERFFQNPGISVLIEWGWNDYDKAPNEGNLIGADDTKTMKKILDGNRKEMLDRRQRARTKYDVMVGVITDFQYSISSDGVFECTTVVSSVGEVYAMMNNVYIQDKNVENAPDPINVSEEEDEDVVKNLLRKCNKRIIIENIKSSTDKSYLSQPNKYIWKPYIRTKDQVGGTRSYTEHQNDIPIPLAGNQFYINWGYIEDNILSNMKLSDEKDTTEFITSAGDKINVITFNSEGIKIGGHRNLISTDENVLLIPNPSAPGFTLQGKYSAGATRPNLKINNHTFPDTGTEEIPTVHSGNIRNLYIHSQFLIDCINDNNTLLEIVNALLNGMEGAASGMWDFEISNQVKTKEDGIILSIIDKNYTGTPVKTFMQDENSYTFKIYKTSSILNNFTFQSDLPKELSSMVVYSRASTLSNNNLSFGNLKDSNINFYTNTLDKLFNKLSINPKKTKTSGLTIYDPKEVDLVGIQEYYVKNFIKYVPDGKSGSLVYVCRDTSTAKTILYEDYTNELNSFNNNILVPITVELTLDGISGLFAGNAFKLDGVPTRYSDQGVWQILGITHTISDGIWSTSIRCQLRVQTKPREKDPVKITSTYTEKTI